MPKGQAGRNACERQHNPAAPCNSPTGKFLISSPRTFTPAARAGVSFPVRGFLLWPRASYGANESELPGAKQVRAVPPV